MAVPAVFICLGDRSEENPLLKTINTTDDDLMPVAFNGSKMFSAEVLL